MLKDLTRLAAKVVFKNGRIVSDKAKIWEETFQNLNVLHRIGQRVEADFGFFVLKQFSQAKREQVAFAADDFNKFFVGLAGRLNLIATVNQQKSFVWRYDQCSGRAAETG